MSSHLSQFFHQRRLDKKFGFGDVARRCGYKNITKGCNRIQKFEDGDEIDTELFQKLTAVLDISDADIARCVEADKTEWEQWADESIEPYIVIRLMAAFYSHKNIPPNIHADQEAMKQFASDFSKEKRLRVCLVLSRRLRVWFDREGGVERTTEDTFDQSYGPYMRVSGKKFLMNLTDC
jgi:hypothetical protein